MVAQYDNFSSEFKDADILFPDITRPILYSLIKINSGKLLDLGCGYGEDLDYFNKNGFETYGIDVSEKMIEEAKIKTKQSKLFVAPFEKLPFEDNKFDVVFSRYALQHSKNIKPIFDEVSRVIKPNGIFVFLVTHPFRQYFEKKTKDYWKSEICNSLILGGKLNV